jgi:serine/threonine protein kinase/TolB-like protein/Tfp pilus assembly protein PilF
MKSSLSPGTKLGRYEILWQLGAGGMGEVYLAEDTQLHRKVALKVLPVAVASNQDRMRRFVQEAQAAAALNHPNIAHVYEIGAAKGLNFIAMEFIDGHTLRELIRDKQADLGKLLRYLQHTAEGLAKAHAAGIVHRDLKPENIMITRDGHAKTLDFGLAKLIEPQSYSGPQPDPASPAEDQVSSQVDTVMLEQHSTPGTVIGTVGYMSPEQAQGKTEEIDHRSDIFSFGCVLFEAITGHRPFEAESKLKSLHKLVYEPAPPINNFNPTAPPDLQRIVRRCLAKDRETRYQTIKEVAIELKEVRRELESSAGVAIAAPSRNDETSTQPGAARTASQSAAAAVTASASVTTPAASAEYLISGIKQHWRSALLALAALVVVTAAVAYFVYSRYASGNGPGTIRSIAVLPFANATGNAEAEYLSDGITESLINAISQLPNLKVMSRSSVFRYKGRETDAAVAGNELGVQAVLTGRMVQRGDALSISVELVKASDNSHLWGQQYDRKLADILSLQNEIAADISEKLRLRLSGEDQKRVTKHYTDNVAAYQLYLRGRFEFNKFTPESMQKGVEYYNQAIAIDPAYALAYAGLSDVYAQEAHIWLPPKEGYTKAKWAAEKAIALDDTLAEAHNAVGLVKLYYDWDFPTAAKEFKQAIELNPNYSGAHSAYSGYFKALRQYPEEIAEAKRGQELDPLSAFTNMELGEAFYHARRYDEAIEQGTRALELDPHFFVAYHVRARAYEQKKMYAEAIADCQEWEKIFPDDPQALASLGHVYASMGKGREAEEIVNKLLEISKQRYFSPYWTAVAYAGLGDNDQAFQYFEKAFEDRYFLMIWMNSDPRMDNLRSDPRFADLVRRIFASK